MGALLLLALLALSGGKRSSSDAPSYGGDDPGAGAMTKKQRLYAMLRALPQLTEDQRLFLMLVAYGESGYSPNAFNKSAGEAAAAGKAYDRIAATFASCGRSRADYATGSGGLFGRLVPYFCNDLRHVEPCIDPKRINDPVLDIASAIVNAHALQGYHSWQGTVGSLRAGWATPGWMDAPPPAKLAKWRGHAKAVGLSPAFIDTKLDKFPSDIESVIATLRAFEGGGGVS